MVILRSFIIFICVIIDGCATYRDSMSYIEPQLSNEDIQFIVNDMVSFLADPLPPARTTLIVDLPIVISDSSNSEQSTIESSQYNENLNDELVNALRERGYGVVIADAETGKSDIQGTPLRYLASQLDNGVVLRLQYPGHIASRFYKRIDGKLRKESPFALKNEG